MSGDYTDLGDYETSIKFIDSDASAASNSTDAQHANVLLHIRGDSKVDVSPVARTLTYGANVAVTGSKTEMPGTTSTAGDGVITAPDAADLTFAGDFTIEVFGATFSSATAQHLIVTHWRTATASRSWRAEYRGNDTPDHLAMLLSSDGDTSTTITGDWTPTGEHDLCFERSGNTIRLYADGVTVGSGTFSGALKDCPGRLVIGSFEATSGATGINTAAGVWGGNWKELRITKAARYASDSGYTVPSRPLPTS
jgi:hypothetical protein